MKTDISRNTFHPERNYSSVRRQQGRVDLDADWNEQVDIQNNRNRILTRDSLGPVGAPANEGGFLLEPSGDSTDLTVSAGRFYIDGLLVNNSAEFNLSSQPDLPGVALPAADGDYLAYLKVYERAVTALEAPAIREIALGGPDTTTRTQVIRQVHLAPVTASDIDSRTIPPEWNSIVSRTPGRMSARTQADGSSDPCAVGARGGYTGLDNLLYRVEIHDGGQAGTATYKWSRDNGTLVTEWLELEGNTLTLRSIGNDNVLNFAPGQWVELTDEGMELEQVPGTLAQIVRVEGRRITINPDSIKHFPGSAGALDINEFSRGTRKARRWDFVGPSGAPMVPDGAGGETWIPLENGIEVKFDDLASGREFRTGDYWIFPARADNNNIEWACDNNGNLEHEPHGIAYHYARLAFINLSGGAWSVIADAREIFPGLTDEELAYVGGDGQLSVPGQILDRPLEVRVTRGATPVADAQVRFTVTSGTGTIEDTPGGSSATTLDIKADSEGIARTYWTLADATAGQSVRAVFLDEGDNETALYVVFGAGSGVASGIQYTPISTDTSVAGTTNVQEALDALAGNKVNRSGDTMSGNLTVNADLEVTGNFTVRGDVIARDAQQQAGDILLGDDDIDRVIIHGTLESNHTSGSLEIEGPVHINATDPAKSPLRVDGPSTGGSPRLYRMPVTLDHTNAGATTVNDYQLLITLDTAVSIAAGRMQAGGDDILFEDDAGNPLPFWIESDINTAATRIWVRIPQIVAGANTTIYMLYGNDGASSQSSAAATFVTTIPGVAAAYNLDEGAGNTLTDLGPNGVNATTSGAVTPAWTTGRFGNGLSFAGTGGDSNAVTGARSWGFSTTGTISAWINIAGAHTEDADGIVAVSANNATNELLLSLNSGRIALYNHPAPNNYNVLTGTTPVNTGQWVHVAGVIDGGITQSDMRIYINGALETGTYSIAGSPGPIQDASDRVLIMGRRTIANQNYYPGLLDHLRVYSAALSGTDIAAIAQGYGYVSPALPGTELIRRTPAAVEPVITSGAEEANPLSDSPIIFAQETSGNVGIGTDNPDQKLAVDGIIHTLQGGIQFPDGTIQTTAGGAGGGGGDPLPLGTIMAWHRDFAGNPVVPEGWVECNGQVLNDPDSPYDGLVIPNLNGEGRFLRGGDPSGTMQDDAFQGHWHESPHDQAVSILFGNGVQFAPGGFNNPYQNSIQGAEDPMPDGVNGTPRTADETRPTNMSVVWIMKIKETGLPGLWTPNSEGIHYSAGKVSVGTNKTDEQLTVTGAISIEEKVLEPETSDDFGKIYVRENDLSHLLLNGTNQYVSMPALGETALGDFTISIWFFRNGPLPEPNNRQYLIDMRGDGSQIETHVPNLILDDGPDGITFLEHSFAWPTGGVSVFHLDLGQINGEWHHTALVREGDTLKAYFDGRLLSDSPSSAAKSDPIDWNHVWRVGTWSNSPGSDPQNYWFNGDLDDLGLWSRALSTDEIAALHNGGRGSDVPTAFASSLLAFYPMSQSATLGQLDDVSGNDFHGTIQNGGTITPERVGTLYFKDGFGNVTALAGGGDSYRTGGSGNQVPLGTIMAWHKSFANTPAIPDGWVECNGQTLDDPASPYHGQTIPDLNNKKEVWNTKGSFLRGDSTSGLFQNDQFQQHIHGVYPHAGTESGEFPINNAGAGGEDPNITRVASGVTSSPVVPPTPIGYGAPRAANETHPVNMSVVWIMKIRETDRDRGLWRENGEDIYFDDGRVGVGVESANTKLHVSSNDLAEAPLRVDAQVTLQGVQGRLYRAPVNLENTDTNDLTDQQIPITLDTAALVSVGKMRFDGADMLFTDTDGKTLLPHFIERDMNSAVTKVWLRVPAIAAGETRRVFLQYGKSDATDLASLDATFINHIGDVAAAYDFDEGTGGTLNDVSGNGINSSTGASWTTGYRGTALSFSGGNDASTGSRNWGFSTSVTVSAWIKTSQMPPGGNAATIMSLDHGNLNDEVAMTVHDTGELRFTSHNAPGVYRAKRSTSNVLTGNWTHVVGVLDGGIDQEDIRVYVNGVLEEGVFDIVGAASPISDATPRALRIGHRRSGVPEHFVGEIDLFRIYSRALTGKEIADLYANQSVFAASAPAGEFLIRPLAVPPNATIDAEEPNPVSGSPVLFAQNLTGNIGIGTDEPAAKLHIAGEAGVDGIMFPDGTVQTTAGGPGGGGDSTPLGTIIAWHKSLSGTPAIPEGWVECNGQILSDADSPFDGQVIPNLNGDGRFLRGGAISGDLQDDAMQGHYHQLRLLNTGYEGDPYNNGAAVHGNWNNDFASQPGTGRDGRVEVAEPRDDGTNGPPRTADETRPINMSVVWIMKVKEVDGQSGLWTPGTEGIRYEDGKVSVGTAVADEQLTVSGAISLEEKILEPDTRDDFGKIYVRENDLSHLLLNGTDQYVEMPSLQRPAVGDFTFACWVRMDPAVRLLDEHSWIFDTREVGTNGPSIETILQATGNGEQVLFVSTGWPTGGGISTKVSIGNPIGEWHHVAVLREGAAMRIYFDGRVLSTTPDAGSVKSDPMPFDKPWRIAQRSTLGNALWKTWPGSLDDFGVWERALSTDEIAALHNGGRGSDVPTGFAPSLLAFYPMRESATPGQLDDVSGNDFHGTIQNGAPIIPEKVGSLYFKDGFGNVTALAGGGDSYRTGGSGNQVPVGTIMAWHKSFTNTPAIPDGWVECNGQTLDDPASPYHGQIIPDLNNPKESWNTKGSFLRGDSTSGDFEDDAFQGHIHSMPPDNLRGSTPAGFQGQGGPNLNFRGLDRTGDPLDDGTNSTPRTGGETKPVNMSVVWIIKIRETDRDRGIWRENGEDIYFDDGKVGIGAKSANAKLHISAEDSTESPLRIDAQTTIQGVQGRLYRAPITLDNTDTNDLVDHQVLLTMDTQTLVTGGKLRFDGGDMLFVDKDGKTVLPHFIESGINTATTRIWVRVPLVPAGGNRVIFMQYGKDDAISQSSAAATFVREIPGIAAAYTFDEGTGTTATDYSGNGNGGNIVGAVWAPDRNGTADRALNFDGVNDRIALGNDAALNIASSITLSAWIFCEGPGTGNQSAAEGNIIAKWFTNTAGSYRLRFNHAAGRKLTMALMESGNTQHNVDSNTILEYNQWYHVAGTYDRASGNLSLYIDGAPDLTTNLGVFDLSQITVPAFIGCFTEANDGSALRGFFDGTIDDPRIHNRALSPAEIAELYSVGGDPTIKAGSDIVRRMAAVEPGIAVAAEEPNPVSGSPILFAQNLTGNIGIGTDDPLARLHIAGTAGVDGIMFPDGSLQTTASQGGDSTPLGTIIAWHKSLTGTPAIPEGWVECNGQTLNDGDSPYDGEVIPDLNGDGRFLRGGGTSGTLQDDAFQGHVHNVSAYAGTSSGEWPVNQSGAQANVAEPQVRGNLTSSPVPPPPEASYGGPRFADETRPINMSVVWIMKIKQTGNMAWMNVPEGIAYTGGRVGIGTATPAHELDVDGTVQCVNLVQTSDARRKKNVAEMNDALSIVDRLRGVRFEWDHAGAGGISPPHGPQVGLIAQEVESVLPEVVVTDRNGYKSVEYGKLVAVLIEAVKELKRER